MSSPTHAHTFKELELEVELPNYLIVEDHGIVNIDPWDYLIKLAKERKWVYSPKRKQRESIGLTGYFESVKKEDYFYHIVSCYRQIKIESMNIRVHGHEEMHALNGCIDITQGINENEFYNLLKTTERISKNLPSLIRHLKSKGFGARKNEILADCGGLHALKIHGFSLDKINMAEYPQLRLALDILAMDKINPYK